MIQKKVNEVERKMHFLKLISVLSKYLNYSNLIRLNKLIYSMFAIYSRCSNLIRLNKWIYSMYSIYSRCSNLIPMIKLIYLMYLVVLRFENEFFVKLRLRLKCYSEVICHRFERRLELQIIDIDHY